MQRESREDRLLFRLGLCLGVVFLALFVLFYGFPELAERLSNSWSCTIRRTFGIYCPGCGGTRALKAMLRGRFLKSLFYHPSVLVFTLYYLCFMFSRPLSRLFPDCVRPLVFRDRHIWLLLGLTALQWILKNCLLLCGYPLW